MTCPPTSTSPALRVLAARGAGAAALAAMLSGLAVAAVLTPAGAAQAAEIYRYKDPSGVWRSMKVPNGYAKLYKRGQVRARLAAGRGAAVELCVTCEPQPGDGASAVAAARPASRALRLGDLKPPPAHDGLIDRAARDSGVDRALLTAVIAIESGFRSDARSPKGALGLMQLMPATAAALLGVADVEKALVDPATNVRAGSRHLRRLIDQYPGRLDLALAAYNAGEGAVRKYDAVPPYAETQQYVKDVIALYEQYRTQ